MLPHLESVVSNLVSLTLGLLVSSCWGRASPGASPQPWTASQVLSQLPTTGKHSWNSAVLYLIESSMRGELSLGVGLGWGLHCCCTANCCPPIKNDPESVIHHGYRASYLVGVAFLETVLAYCLSARVDTMCIHSGNPQIGPL